MPPSATKNANERLIDRIDAALPDADEDSARVLRYVRGEITRAGIEKRTERADPSVDENVTHLHQVAEEHLRHINRKESA